MNRTDHTHIPQLAAIWRKAIEGAPLHQDVQQATLEHAILDILGLGLLPTYQFLHGTKPDLETFEKWVIAQCGGRIPADKIQQCKTLMSEQIPTPVNNDTAVLSPEDWLHWETQGYVIIKNAISTEAATQSRAAIYNFLQMDEQDPRTWYQSSEHIQGIMVNLYDDECIRNNRNAPRIKKAFQELWQQDTLIPVADKCGFNPPETQQSKYRGIGLHWDVSLITPVPFGTQGILYLSDTATNQGALTVVPGFHKKLDAWLDALPPGTDPRNVDLSVYGPVPLAANAGDLIIWDQRLPHAGSPNTASLPRVVQYINWYSPLRVVQEEWK